jgi:two-component system OmpR family response regulator
MTARVLVVEDDPSIAAGIVQGLRRFGFDVSLSTQGNDAVLQALARPFDVIVLDLMLPEQSGFEVMAQLRSRLRIPIIVLTARTGLRDRLASFELGAADFVAKPFFVDELVARIRARLPRAEPAPTRTRRFGQVEIDVDGSSVLVKGQNAPLTRTELSLLLYLFERPGRAVSRDQIAADVLLGLDEQSGRTVDSHVARLRKKLGDDAARIATVWGIGYRFTADEGESV